MVSITIYFSGLKDIMELFYVPLTKETISGGIPILIPNGKKWSKHMHTILKEGTGGLFINEIAPNDFLYSHI